MSAAPKTDDVFSSLFNATLIDFQYNTLKNSAQDEGSTLYPDYGTIKKWKKICYLDNYGIAETIAEMPLQGLLNRRTRQLNVVSFENNVRNV